MAKITVRDMINIAGGPSAVARKFKLKPWAVSLWCNRGVVPVEHVPDLYLMLGGVVQMWDMHPHYAKMRKMGLLVKS